MNAKGMSMAIQIFIVLFVLLAVAMLVLQLVSEQFKQQGGELKKYQNKQKAEKQRADAESDCLSKCDCDTARGRANFCIALVKTEGTLGLDLTYDGQINGDDGGYDSTELLVGTGICEDRIYCSQLVSCECGNLELTMRSCLAQLCRYWQKEEGLTAEEGTARLLDLIKPGNCSYSGQLREDGTVNHWFADLEAQGKLDCSQYPV